MAQKNNKKSKSNKKVSHFAWACWALILIFILLIFLVKKDTIISNLKNTSFFDRVFGTTPQFVEKHEDKENKSKENPADSIVQKIEKQKDNVINLAIPSDKKDISINDLKKSSENSSGEKEASQKVKTNDISENLENVKESVPENIEKSESKQTSEEKNNQKAAEKVVQEKTEEIKKTETITPVEEKKSEVTLCFVLIDSEGGVSRKEIKRTVSKNDSPLTTAINLLLQGPSVTNTSEKNCISLIPEGTKLLGAKVTDGIAYLNFSDDFEFNTYGVEGYKHQLEQIVFTATSFSTVKSVQFLIEGEKVDYLGSEGMWIGSPLSRSSF